jgi:hypothetical protein
MQRRWKPHWNYKSSAGWYSAVQPWTSVSRAECSLRLTGFLTWRLPDLWIKLCERQIPRSPLFLLLFHSLIPSQLSFPKCGQVVRGAVHPHSSASFIDYLNTSKINETSQRGSLWNHLQMSHMNDTFLNKNFILHKIPNASVLKPTVACTWYIQSSNYDSPIWHMYMTK